MRYGFLVLGLLLVAAPDRALAQLALADDILAATSGGAGGPPGVQPKPVPATLKTFAAGEAPTFRQSPGGTNLVFGGPGFGGLPQAVAAPGAPESLTDPGRDRVGPVERVLRIPRTIQFAPPVTEPPPAFAGTLGMPDLPDRLDDGPPHGMSLDDAIDRLVRDNPDLRVKGYEIPIARADIITAGQRNNPLFFTSATGIPYGSYSMFRPGAVTYAASITVGIDWNGKRRARIAIATQAKKVVEAQYQDAVRLQIEQLHTAWVNLLDARAALQFAQASVARLDRIIELARGKAGKGAPDVLSVMLEREVALMLINTEQTRLLKARQSLAGLLGVPADEAHALEVRGALDLDVPPPPIPELIDTALKCRPDLSAARLGIERARRDVDLALKNRLPNIFPVYTPYSYIDRQYQGVGDSGAWSIGMFMPLPLFNRNQGNIERARLTVGQSHSQVEALERQVVTEVQQAAAELEHSAEQLRRIRTELLPAVREMRDQAFERYQKNEIDAAKYLQTQRDFSSVVRLYRNALVRHRSNMLQLNTAVGIRLLP